MVACIDAAFIGSASQLFSLCLPWCTGKYNILCFSFWNSLFFIYIF